MCAQNTKQPRPLMTSVITNRCPHCREGKLFTYPNPYNLMHNLDMPEHCPVCGQAFEIQVGFYYGTGYVSYALCIIVTALFFLMWYAAGQISIQDNSIFWWFGANSLLLILLQPILQRLSRSIWIAFFVKYQPGRVNL